LDQLRLAAVRLFPSEAHTANPLIAGIRNIEFSLQIEADAGGTIKLSALRGAAVAAETSYTSTCDNSDGVALRIQTANLITS